MKKQILLAFAAFGVAMTLHAQFPATPDTLEFQGRKIDVSPFFNAFPYSQFRVSDDGTKLFFLKSGAESQMQWIELDGKSNILEGKEAIHADLSKRNGWSPEYNAADGRVYWLGDEHNEERFNIYRSNLNHPGQPERITDVPYVYEWGFNHDKSKIAYVGRMGQNEKRLDELHILDLNTMKDTLIGVDTPQYRYTWGAITFRPDGTGIILTALKNADRKYCTMGYVDLRTNKFTPFNRPDRQASFSGCDIMNDWLDNDHAYYFSDDDGYRNLYAVDLRNFSCKQLTHFKEPLQSARLVKSGKKQYLFAVLSTPIQSTLLLLDPLTGKEVYRQESPLNYTVGSAKGDKIRAVAFNNTTLVKVVELGMKKNKITENTLVELPEDLQSSLVTGTVERLSIPTFDTDPATGKTRMIHAYLYKPAHPLPADKSVLMVESFYGGENYYNSEYQIYNKAGIYVLSPSPRGSDGFGRDFAAMNDGDLGGNEIIDVMKCTKEVADKLNIPAERVGCFGVSHGGYATMRLMTFPGEINGNKFDYPYGFGVETAGFADIIYQQYHTNIPDWTLLEAGDPVKDYAKLIDRSPLYHAELISGPLLLCHGNSDNRVDIEGSRLMARKLFSLKKPCRYVEFEGLGHGVKGKEPLKKFYREVFKFLDNILNHHIEDIH
ncbi:MAG: S9 family peptidase [Prevotella sp.]|jgi:dipeptidyl aminopeptidase/acylaminoacyl peptidase